MPLDMFKLIGYLGILLLVFGIITKKGKTRDKYFIVGGLSLIVYSIYINDLVFIILQIIFTLAAVYDLNKNRK